MSQPMTRVRAVLAILLASVVAASALVGATIQSAQAIAAPANLRAVVKTPQAVAMAWSKTGEDAYRVRFSTSSNMKSNQDTWDVLGNYLEWTHLDRNPLNDSPRLKPGESYYFQVKAIDREDRYTNLSSYGPVVKVTLPTKGKPELRPTKVRATPAGADSMYVSWLSRGPGHKYILRYTTDRSKSVLKWDKVGSFDTHGTVVTGLKPNTKYYFRARVVDTKGKAVSDYSANSSSFNGTTPRSTEEPRISLVSYNVRKASGSPSWGSRRQAVANTMLAEDPDVIALQEATPLTYQGRKQYDDIVDLLGDDYKLVTRTGSSGTKIVYDTTRFDVVDTGVKELATLGSAERYAVWTILEDRRTGGQFFLINTHLEPGDQIAKYNEWRIRQSREILDLIEDNAGDLPVVIAGDMNSSRNADPNNGQYEVFTGAGYVDPLDNAVMNSASGFDAITEHLLDVIYNSANKLRAKAPLTPYPVGTYIDYVYTSPDIRVGSFRTKVDLDKDGEFVGTIPSDHNLLAVNLHVDPTASID